MRPILTFYLLLFTSTAFAQLTLQVTGVPANTPAGATLYVAGDFNTWNPGASAYALTNLGNGQYSITLPTTLRGAISFKFTRGTWPNNEATANGGQLPNRTFTIPATGAVTYTTTIAAWADLTSQPSTASPSVSIMSTAFQMPELNRTRRIWLYLPPDYATSTKTYPVLYMHDGQNLFDATTSFSGEWGVDETLDQLHRQGYWGCIVVGIDNGGGQRLNEYTPYPNAQIGGGQGTAYVNFIANTLKPYIDNNYRTRPDRLNTGIMGSSLGGLISLYAALYKPDVFGRAGVFSPSLWFSQRIYSLARTTPLSQPNPRMHLMSGGRESQGQLRDHFRMADTLALAGYALGTEVDTATHADGEHKEWFWRREFASAYRYLFAGTGPVATKPSFKIAELEIFPNPQDLQGRLTIRHATAPEGTPVEVYDLKGKRVRTTRLQKGQAELDVKTLLHGTYQIRMRSGKQKWNEAWVR